MSTVMVVDDGNDIRALMVELLRIHGHDSVEAATGAEALSLLDSGVHPDLVVLDVQMPGLDGWQTLQAIRTGTETQALPVILCTVKQSDLDTALAWELGCDAYVTKPFAIAQLVREIDNVLARSADQRESRRREIRAGIGRA
jgi:DNA-binding response OmpR family regulator